MVCQLYLEGNKIDSNFFRGIIAMSLLPINNNKVTIYKLKLCRNNFFLELLQIVVTRLVSEISLSLANVSIYGEHNKAYDEWMNLGNRKWLLPPRVAIITTRAIKSKK